ncbi:ABC transporter ATP-binding protein [Hyphobacterium sp. HN65]|uniref:ABC transporter ATP-binding protein n=1 Tax=Hyphobacterium lacteum TaxID=3116575 RepID=A0ABU7LT32_9PROT|nr:ABC transporter ATP-binding protein [Hyphobacterium sp. HN65]MEE2527088.1 ABC transporter ATP-binding protein [Hyphobacterium sp. HN65]
MTAPVLTIRGAEKALGGQPILKGVDLDLAPGCIMAVLGPSGAGKSTLLRVIAGLEKLDAGQLASGSQNWDGSSRFIPAQQRRIGFVFQDYALFPHLTVRDNIAFGLQELPREERAARTEELMQTVEISRLAGSYPHELSGGEQQRVALARALAPRPEIVLLDEPFSSLDRRLRSELRQQTIEAIKQSGAAALIVTHDADEAFETADQLALMEDGKIVQTGAPLDVYMRPASLTCARLLGDLNVLPARVKSGAIATPFGPIPSGKFADDTTVYVLVRPEALVQNGEGAECVVQSASVRQGRLLARVSSPDESIWLSDMPLSAGMEKGETVSLALDLEKISILPV